MFTIKRRLMAVAAVTVLAVAQVIPASAGTVGLNSGWCEGWGYTDLLSSWATGGTIRTAGNCYGNSQQYVYDPILSEYYFVIGDHDVDGFAYTAYYGSYQAAGNFNQLCQNGTGYGTSGWSWD